MITTNLFESYVLPHLGPSAEQFKDEKGYFVALRCPLPDTHTANEYLQKLPGLITEFLESIPEYRKLKRELETEKESVAYWKGKYEVLGQAITLTQQIQFK